jgi:hypothetical protein
MRLRRIYKCEAPDYVIGNRALRYQGFCDHGFAEVSVSFKFYHQEMKQQPLLLFNLNGSR